MSYRRLTVQSPVGRLILVADDEGLTHLMFANSDLGAAGLDASEVPERADDVVLCEAAAQLDQYFAGERTAFDLPLHPQGNAFELDAWMALAAIPYGETISYGEQSRAIGREGAFRAVGSANGRNPLAIILPCHRVVGADGTLVGFGGGLDVKRALLDLESGVQHLF
jgi:methylated-DNA-[protein]-cysteine S-methyltransferase